MTKIPLKFFKISGQAIKINILKVSPSRTSFLTEYTIIFKQYHFTITYYKKIILINLPIKVI